MWLKGLPHCGPERARDRISSAATRPGERRRAGASRNRCPHRRRGVDEDDKAASAGGRPGRDNGFLRITKDSASLDLLFSRERMDRLPDLEAAWAESGGDVRVTDTPHADPFMAAVVLYVKAARSLSVLWRWRHRAAGRHPPAGQLKSCDVV